SSDRLRGAAAESLGPGQVRPHVVGADRACRKQRDRQGCDREPAHHGCDCPRMEKPPLGPASSTSASRTLVRAPSGTSSSPRCSPSTWFMSVFTYPGWMVLTLIALSLSSQASCTVHALTALLDTL